MPRRRRSRKSVKRRTFKKRRSLTRIRSRYNAARYPTPRNFLPKRMVTHFTYCDKFLLDLETAHTGVKAYRFTMNGLYDPNISGIGHQPRGADQAATMFKKYLVIGSKATVHFGMSKSNGEAFLVGLCKNKDASFPRPEWIDYAEPRDAKIKHMHEDCKGYAPSLSIGYSAKKDNPVTNPLDRENSLGAIWAANPSSQTWLDVWAANADGSLSNGPILDCTITIRYSVVLLDPISPGQS